MAQNFMPGESGGMPNELWRRMFGINMGPDMYPGQGTLFPRQNLPPMQSPTMPQGGGVREYVQSLQREMDAMFPAPPEPTGWKAALERGLMGAALVGEGSDTTGGNIAAVANALLGVGPAIQQRRTQQRFAPMAQLQPMMEFQKAMLEHQKQQAELGAMPIDQDFKRAQADMYRAYAEQARRPEAAPEGQWQPIEEGIHTQGGTMYVPMYNVKTGERRTDKVPFGQGASLLKNTTGGSGTDYAKYEQRYINSLNHDRARRGLPPLTQEEEDYARAAAYQRIAGQRAGATQELTGGVGESTNITLAAEIKPLQDELDAINKKLEDPITAVLSTPEELAEIETRKAELQAEIDRRTGARTGQPVQRAMPTQPNMLELMQRLLNEE